MRAGIRQLVKILTISVVLEKDSRSQITVITLEIFGGMENCEFRKAFKSNPKQQMFLAKKMTCYFS